MNWPARTWRGIKAPRFIKSSIFLSRCSSRAKLTGSYRLQSILVNREQLTVAVAPEGIQMELDAVWRESCLRERDFFRAWRARRTIITRMVKAQDSTKSLPPSSQSTG